MGKYRVETTNGTYEVETEDEKQLGAPARAIYSLGEQLNPVTKLMGLVSAAEDPVGTVKGIGAANEDLARKAMKSFGEKRYVDAATQGINYIANAIPGLGSSIEAQQEKIRKGDIAGGMAGSLGVGVDLAVTPKVPAMVRSVGRGLQRAAVPVAESAMGIGRMDRAYGKTPGKVILEETSGFKPETVAASARQAIKRIMAELETLYGGVQDKASLANAKNLLKEKSKLSAAGNSADTPAELGKMASQLTDIRRGFAGATEYPAGATTPITIQPGARNPFTGQRTPPKVVSSGAPPAMEVAVEQDPLQLLRMKREFGNDFTKRNPLNPQREMGTARKVYRELDKELDRVAPEGRDMNQRSSSLIAAEQAAQNKALNAGIIQNLMHRGSVPTGALTGAVGGGHAFGPLGFAAGLVGPVIASDAAVRMGAARGIYGAGKAVGKTARVAGAANAAGTVLKRSEEDDPLGLFQ